MATVANITLSLGFLSVPLKVSPAARAQGPTSFNLLHSCGSRINIKNYCPVCDRSVERAELHKGYEYADGHYVTVTEEELKQCAPDSSSIVEITSTVKASEIDPMLLEASYYLAPDTDKKKNVIGGAAYNVIAQSLKTYGLFAIGKIFLHGREHAVIIRPLPNGGLAMHTMFYQDEVREAPVTPRNQPVPRSPTARRPNASTGRYRVLPSSSQKRMPMA